MKTTGAAHSFLSKSPRMDARYVVGWPRKALSATGGSQILSGSRLFLFTIRITMFSGLFSGSRRRSGRGRITSVILASPDLNIHSLRELNFPETTPHVDGDLVRGGMRTPRPVSPR